MLEVPNPGAKEMPSFAETTPRRIVAKSRRRNGMRLLAAGVALLAIVIAAIAAWGAFLRPISVEAAAAASDVPVQVFGLGTVEARVSSKVGFQVPGVLVELGADVGDHVEKDAVIARLDARAQQALVSRADAALQQAAAGLERAEASLDKAKVNYASAKNVSARRQTLLRGDTASPEAAETAQAAEDAARADVSLAQSDVLVARANIADARAQQQQQATVLGFYTVRAPYDAMVTSRNEELGSALTAGEPVFTLIDPKTVWVLSYVDESKAGEIRVGEPTTIVLRSRPDERLAGRVARIQPESDRVNEERKVEVAFDRLPAGFNLGEQAEVHVTTVRLPRALLVPEGAILGLSQDHGTVWTVEDGRLRQRRVTLGHRLLDGRYEITEGVPDGALVVTRLGGGLRVGREAKVVEGRET